MECCKEKKEVMLVLVALQVGAVAVAVDVAVVAIIMVAGVNWVLGRFMV